MIENESKNSLTLHIPSVTLLRFEKIISYFLARRCLLVHLRKKEELCH